MRKEIELLAPAGKMESLKAAVQNGADAVYLGGELFSARASANNFSNEELADGIFYAHFRNVKVYVTVNTVLDDIEVEKAIEYVRFLNNLGVDGIIVQDLGLSMLIRDYFPNIELHASTQMTINSLEGARFLEKNGFSRVVLARETPLSEIELIKKHTNLKIEAFAHGALCVSFSGQCLMSSMIGGRSGNRGRCAQPCRKSYEVVNENGKVLPIERAYLISPMDLYTLENIDKLIELGVDSIKLEGRMKRPEYVATVTNAYRKAIDEKSIKGEKKKLKQAFNRGFTEGLPFGAFGRDFVNTDRPDNRGLVVGKTKFSKNNKSVFNIYENLNEGDLLEFETFNGRKTFSLENNVNSGEAIINLPFKPIEGSEVRRIKNEKELERIRKTYEKDSFERPIEFYFEGKIGEFPKLTLLGENYFYVAVGDEEVEPARKAPMDEKKIRKQLDRLGDTSLYLSKLNLDIDENIFIPVSVLNGLRREATEAYKNHLETNMKRDDKKVKLNKEKNPLEEKDLKISVSLLEKDQFYKIDIDTVDRFYLRFLDKDVIDILNNKNKEVYYRSGKILYHEDYKRLSEELENYKLSGVLIDNLGGIEGFSDYEKIGDLGLNVFNSYSVDFLNENNIENLILSPELTLSQIEEITQKTNVKLESIAYGFIEVMTMKHCPFSTIKNCGKDRDCEVCNFKEGYLLRDEMNVDFPARRENDFSTIYNSYPISMVEEMEKLSKSGLDSVLLSFTFEENPQELIDEFLKGKKGISSNLNNKLREKYGNITHGHYFRGVE